jgi:alpha-galactosidase
LAALQPPRERIQVPRPVRISVIGAGSAAFSLGLVKDLCLSENLAGSEVSFMDVDAQRLEMVHQLAVRYAGELGSDLRFESTLDRSDSLRDADFVINTAYVAGHHHEARTREIYAKHGYYYTGIDGGVYTFAVGEVHQFRFMLEVAHDIERICPDAWLLQCGNPVFDGTTLITRETGVKTIGLCHGHNGALEIAETIELDPSRVTYLAPGLNHCIWLTHFLYDGQNAYPRIDEWIEAKGEVYWRTHEAAHTHDIQMSRGACHQYRMYGLFPIGDTIRQAGWWYNTDLATKRHWFGETFGGPDNEVARPYYVANHERRLAEARRVALDSGASVVGFLGTTRTHEEQVPIIDALTNNVGGVFQVNTPNNGAIEGLPDDVATEGPATIDGMGIRRHRIGALPKKVMLERVLPLWLQMERGLEAFKSGDWSILLLNTLESHKTRSYEQAVATLEDTLAMEGHADIARHYRRQQSL